MSSARGISHATSITFVIGCTIFVGLIAVSLWAVLGGGPSQEVDSDGEDALVLAQSDEVGEADASDSMSEQDSIEVTYDVFLSRDPFQSIMPPEPETTEDGDPADPSDPTSPSDPSDPNDPSDPTRPGGKDDGTCVAGTEAVCDGQVLVLQETTAATATIAVNGTVYTVLPGQAFATSYLLLSIDGDCVNVVYLNGDEAETVRLCIGATTVK